VERGIRGLSKVGVCSALRQQDVGIKPVEYQRKGALLAIVLSHVVQEKTGIATDIDQQESLPVEFVPVEFVQSLESVA